MKHKLRIAGMEQQIDESQQAVNSNQHQAYSSTSNTPIPPNQPVPVAPNDTPDTLSSVFSTPHERLELDSETTSAFRWASSYGMASQIPYEARNIKSGEIIVMAEGYHTEGTQNIISAAAGDEDKASLNLVIASQKVSSIFSRRRITFALCVVSFGVLFPVIVVKLFRANEQSQAIQSSTPRYEKMLYDNPPVSEVQLMWRKHVVVGGDNRLLIPETFESRLNAEVAPLLEEHVGQVWDHRSYPELICRSGEHLIVRFSMMKSSTLPASLSHKADCTATSNTRTSCFQRKALSDVRDLTVTLPSKSSRYMFSVKLTENVKQTAQQRNSSMSKTISLGTISGPFDIELLESSILAIHRYCGTHRKEFVDDLNVKAATLENTRLLTIYELKRLYALWSRLKSNTFLRREHVWDTNHLSKATIDPIEHSRHMPSSFDAKSLQSKTRSASSDKTQISSPSVHLATLRDLQNMYQRNDSDAVTQLSPEADSMIAKQSAPPSEHLPTPLEKRVRRESPFEQRALEPWHHNSEAFSGPQDTVDSQEDARFEAAVKSPSDSATSTPHRSDRATDSGVWGQLQDNNLEMNPQSGTARGSHKHEQKRGRIYRKLSLHQTTTPPSPGTPAGQHMETSHVPYQVAVRTPGALETTTKQNKHGHDHNRSKQYVPNNTVLLPFKSPPPGSAHTVSSRSSTIERYSFKPQRPRPDKGEVYRFPAEPPQHVFKSQPHRSSVPEGESFQSPRNMNSHLRRPETNRYDAPYATRRGLPPARLVSKPFSLNRGVDRRPRESVVDAGPVQRTHPKS